MKNLRLKIPVILISLVFIVGCAVIPTTNTAKNRLYQSVIPEYIVYVKTDKNLTNTEKNIKIDRLPNMSYDQLCGMMIPEYISYLKNDPSLKTNPRLQKSYIIKAESYLKVKKHFDTRGTK
jgi:hypothetical protein